MQLNSDAVQMRGKFVAATERGILIDILEIEDSGAPFGTEEWLPKSQVMTLLDVDINSMAKGDEFHFELPTWLALERGLFDDDSGR